MDFNNVSPAIVIVIYILCEIAKKTFLKSDEGRKLIPLICAGLGIVAAVALFFVYPEGLGASNVLEAITTGALSGMAATGCNQLYKKFSKFNGENTEEFFTQEEILADDPSTDEEITIDESSSNGEGY